MTILILIAILFCAAYATAYFSYMMDNFFDEGMIFQGWLPFLQKRIGDDSFWYKPLGGCVKCANVWHSFATYFATITLLELWQIGIWHIPVLIAYVASSNGILRKKLLTE